MFFVAATVKIQEYVMRQPDFYSSHATFLM